MDKVWYKGTIKNMDIHPIDDICFTSIFIFWRQNQSPHPIK